MSGGKINKESFTELAEFKRSCLQTTDVTSSTVKPHRRNQKESQERKKEETTAERRDS